MATGDPTDYEAAKFIWTVLLVPLGWIGWIVKTVSGNQRELEKDLSNHKLYAANNFVKHADLKATEERILDAIKGLRSELRNKVDK